jgi:acetyl-CoA acetyltransferase
MRKVAVVGVGITKFGSRRPDATFWELAYDAVRLAMEDAGFKNLSMVDSAVIGMFHDMLARQVAPEDHIYEYIGMADKPGTRVAGGGATGAVAARVGFMEVASGLSDMSIVVGTEKFTDVLNTAEQLKTIGYILDNNFSPASLGTTGFNSFAPQIQRHMHEFGTTEVQMAKIAVKNRKNALNNPNAHGGKVITVEDVLKSRMIGTPYKFYDCCLYSEGAAAIIFACEEKAKKFPKKPVWITGIGSATAAGRAGDRPRVPGHSTYISIVQAAKQAYKMAGITNPLKEIDVAEIHDAFTGVELMTYEDLGFCEKGKGGEFIDKGMPEMAGALPVNPSGGLLGFGHPIGGTGIWQIGMITNQIRGEAGKMQVKNGKVKRGLAGNGGGEGMCNYVVHILEG